MGKELTFSTDNGDFGGSKVVESESEDKWRFRLEVFDLFDLLGSAQRPD